MLVVTANVPKLAWRSLPVTARRAHLSTSAPRRAKNQVYTPYVSRLAFYPPSELQCR